MTMTACVWGTGCANASEDVSISHEKGRRQKYT